MSALARRLPSFCSRLSIFVCYAHEDRALAEEIAQALTNDGHEVFIDANKLKVSGDYHEDIRHAIEAAERFIFLISRASMARGKYPQTELGFAQQRWPSPEGAVWPVLVDAEIDVAQLPVYLRSVQIYRVKGNAPAEIAAEMDASRVVKPRFLMALAGLLAVLVVGTGIYLNGGLAPTNFTLMPPQQVDFRPSAKPGPDSAWTKSWLAITLIPVQYSNEGGAAVRIQDETVLLAIKDRLVPFKWFNEVEMRSGCADWLCTKGSVGVSTLTANGTLRRETMYQPAPAAAVSWMEFLDAVCASTGDALDLTLSATVTTSSVTGSVGQNRTTTCRIDLKEMRQRLEKLGCATGMAQVPLRLSPTCRM